jgi:hypothetical protein
MRVLKAVEAAVMDRWAGGKGYPPVEVRDLFL